ncbi:hypothetical protein [Microbacterium album]|uniref:Uncharacterized protein n=1 Tax=Microbacterium album TaxID=2053191 RepID=A0A917IJR6_9MICO|nr:hypothetical protein [Microbacterium album]GGH51022.1 hypothetical protein GCM10010921_30190 [Microbacterium album]
MDPKYDWLIPQLRFYGRAHTRALEKRLGPIAMNHYRTARRFITLGVFLHLALFALGALLIIVVPWFTGDVVVVFVLIHPIPFLAALAISYIEFRRARLRAGEFHGLSRQESLRLKVIAPEDFDDTLERALRRRRWRETHHEEHEAGYI